MTTGQASSMVLGPGYVVSISVSNSPEFAMKLRVEANGGVGKSLEFVLTLSQRHGRMLVLARQWSRKTLIPLVAHV